MEHGANAPRRTLTLRMSPSTGTKRPIDTLTAFHPNSTHPRTKTHPIFPFSTYHKETIPPATSTTCPPSRWVPQYTDIASVPQPPARSSAQLAAMTIRPSQYNRRIGCIVSCPHPQSEDRRLDFRYLAVKRAIA